MTTLIHTTELVVVTCWCGMPHAVPRELREHQQAHHRDGRKDVSIYCPLGHTYVIAGEGKAARLQRKLDEERRQRANADEDLRAERAAHTATKGQLTKARKRAERGVCPHPECKRSFVDVARHVRTKHRELLEQ